MTRPVAPAVVVRALETDREIDAFCALAATTFTGYHRLHCTPRPGDNLSLGWRRFQEEAPDFEPSQLRGAFSDGALVGGASLSAESFVRLVKEGSTP